MPRLIYFQEIVGEQIECECGYESDYVNYDINIGESVDACEEWTCPQCGKTERLDEDFR